MTEQEFRKKLTESLITYRKLNGLTQAQLAALIGYSDKSVSKWERGDGVPDAYTLLTLSEVYHISVSELIGQAAKSRETNQKLKEAEKERKKTEKAKKKLLERIKKKKQNAEQ